MNELMLLAVLYSALGMVFLVLRLRGSAPWVLFLCALV